MGRSSLRVKGQGRQWTWRIEGGEEGCGGEFQDREDVVGDKKGCS